jgi:hypothetical protein
VTLNAGYLYQNALPFHFQSWTWEATANWRSGEQKKEGSYALQVAFSAAGGTVGMNGPAVDIKTMKSISLSVYPDAAVGDLYLNLYDKDGAALGMQSLAWYMPSGALAPNAWNDVEIPLDNFFATSSSARSISGFSISGKNPGSAYIDSVQLTKKEISHAIWVAPPEALALPFNPFATSTPVNLPYTFTPTPDNLAQWFTYFGSFGPGSSGEIELGPSAATKSNGSMTIFRGGRFWSDYHIDATINWGETSVFSLLGRFTSDGDFVSCAFSRYGETAQIYDMKGGTSNFVAQTPPLAVKDFQPWIGVNVGMELRGNRASCFIGGTEVLQANLPDIEAKGTVGFETWDPNPSAAPHTLTSLSVTPLTGE